MSKPIAVLTSDIHYTPSTLDLAQESLHQALTKAEELKVPLIDMGDILDSKAIIRAECANALIDILSRTSVEVILIGGNHTLINSKSMEHSLNFLRPYVTVVDKVKYNVELESYLVPYQDDAAQMQLILDRIPEGSRILTHTGVQTAYMGHYVQDTSSLPREAFANYRVISGHYHRAQDIKCGRPQTGAVGLFSYVGNPYTLSFSEANDGPKGYQILTEDGILRMVPTNLRKHIVLERTTDNVLEPVENYNHGDKVWLKVSGTRLELDKLNRHEIGETLFGQHDFKLDKICIDTVKGTVLKGISTDAEILDNLIESTSQENKPELKALWRRLVS